MWLMTTTGFFSTIAMSDGKRVMVRARKRADLVALLRRVGAANRIHRTEKADYLYRVFTTIRRWMKWVAILAADIDYPNFKDAIKAKNPERAALYGKVWTTLLDVEKEEPCS